MVEAWQTPERKEAVSRAASFDLLYEVLEGFDTIPGGHRDYPAAELIGRIEGVRADQALLGFITNTAGIRDKVRGLLNPEKMIPE